MPQHEFPGFPIAFAEEDVERIRELERLAVEQRRAYRGLMPWERKPLVERVVRRVAEKALDFPKWVRGITPWEERGFTPEQADIFLRETEAELLELKRRQTVTGRLPSIMDYITALAMEGLLTGEEAQLYELIPELNPRTPEGLNLSEEEREWFLEYGKSLAGESRESILNIYAEGGFPAPKTISELMELVETTFPHDPRQVQATIEFLKDSEEVAQALRDMYPSQVDEEVSPTKNINIELDRLGLTPTGDVKKDIEALEKARLEQVKEEGISAQAMLEDGRVVNVNVRDERDVYFEGELVAHYNPETKELVPTAELEVMPLLSERERRVIYDQRMLEIDTEYTDMADWTVEGWQERRKADPERFQEWQDARTVVFNDWRYGHLPLKEPLDTWEAMQVFGVGLTKLLPQVGVAVLQAVQSAQATRRGEAGAGASVVDRDWADRFIADTGKNLNQFVSEVGEKFEGRIPLELAQFPRNLAFSLTSMGAGLGIGIPIALAPIPGARIWAYVSGTAASGEVAYHITKYQIVQQYLELKNEESKAELGREITLDEENRLKVDFEKLANEYGLWEAIPEAVSNLAFVSILTAPMTSMMGRYLAVKIVGKITAMYGQELLTETITQKGQSAIEIEAGLREGRISWVEAFKEIAPQTFLLTTVMAGAGTVIINTPTAINKIKASLKAEIGEAHPLYDGLEKEALSRQAEITPPVTPPEVVPAVPEVTPAPVEAVPEALEGGFSGIFFRTEVAVAPPSGVTFFSKNRDYAEQLQVLRGKGEIREELLTVTNPLVVEVTERQLADPDFEKPYIDEAIAEGNDAVVFFNRASGDIFVATVKPPAVEVAPVEPTITEVHAEEIDYLGGRLAVIDKELESRRKDIRTQSTRIEGTVLPDERLELQESIKNLESLIQELNIKKASIQSKTGILRGEPITGEAALGIVGEESWNKLPYPSKLALADRAGIAKTAARLPWNELTGTQQDKLRTIPLAVIPTEKAAAAVINTEGLTAEEIIDGKGVNVEERLSQAEGSGDVHFEKISPDEMARTKEEAREHLDTLADLSLHVDITIPIHRALGYAWRLGDITAFVDALPSTFEVTQEFLDAKFNESDTPMWNLHIQPVLDAFAVIDNGRDIIAPGQALARKNIQLVGELGGLAQQNISQVWTGMVREARHLSGIRKPRAVSRKVWKHDLFMLGHQVGKEDVIVPIEDILGRKEIQEIVGGYTQDVQESMVSYAQLTAHLLHNVFLPSQNAVRAKLGRDLIPEIDKYLPWIHEVNVWGNLFGYHLKPDFVMETASQPDFIKPIGPVNIHALSRKAGMGAYEKVEDIERILMDYVGVATRDMFFTPVVLNTKAYVKAFRDMGQEVPARYVESWALERYAGMPGAWTRGWNDYVPQFITRPLVGLNRSLTRSVFPLNFQWNLIVQPSSTGLGILRYGSKNVIKGLDALWNPEARAMVRETYSHILKSRGKGSVVHQDMGAVITEAQKVRRGKMDTVADYLNFFTRWLELVLTDVSSRAAYYDGIDKGMKPGFELSFHTADGGAKVQSMYDTPHVPGIINTPLFRYFIRFQTFAFEALTRVRELANIKWLPKAGAYQTVATDSIQGKTLTRIRVRKFFEFMIAMWVINVVGDLVIDRKPWEMSSFLPAASLMMLSTDPHKTWNLPVPMRYVWEVWKGFDGLIEYGNWRPLTEWALRWHLPAGVAASRTIQGIITVIDEGSVKDVKARELYKIEPDEYIQAIVMGPWQTATGREYRERMFEGVDETINSILKGLERDRDELGTSVEGEYQTLGGYLTKVNNILISSEEVNRNLIEKLAGESGIEWTGLLEYQILDEGSGFHILTQFAVYSEKILWEEYKNTPSEDRLKYRKNNPYIDASLYFWEKVGTLRSNEAGDYLERLFEQFISDNLRAHWRGLPAIPEEIKLLPD